MAIYCKKQIKCHITSFSMHRIYGHTCIRGFKDFVQKRQHSLMHVHTGGYAPSPVTCFLWILRRTMLLRPLCSIFWLWHRIQHAEFYRNASKTAPVVLCAVRQPQFSCTLNNMCIFTGEACSLYLAGTCITVCKMPYFYRLTKCIQCAGSPKMQF